MGQYVVNSLCSISFYIKFSSLWLEISSENLDELRLPYFVELVDNVVLTSMKNYLHTFENKKISYPY